MKTLLNNANRPFVQFDATSVEHRRAYQLFTKTQCWGYIPYRFKLEAPFLNLVDMIEDKMCRYYVEKEFGDV